MPSPQKSFMLEDAELLYRNFKGTAGMYNREGERSFCVFLTPEFAAELAADGWTPKQTKPREDEEEGRPYIQVKVKYDFKPPRIVMKTSTATTTMSEDMIEVLDYVDIKSADLICNGSNWDVNGKQGTAAYLKTLVVIVNEDPLELKYGLNYFEEPEVAFE